MSALSFSSAAERNKEPILEQLVRLLPASGRLLEIGSGSGQHAVYFSPRLPGLDWQASEKAENLAPLATRIRFEGGKNVLPPLQLDVLTDPWPDASYVAAFSANTAHFIPWNAVMAMFGGLSSCLMPGAVFCLYGPFNINNAFTSRSNEQFDGWLRKSDPMRGIRDLAAIETLASACDIQLQQCITMPANNFLLEFRKT